MKLLDLHCDTPAALYLRRASLDRNDLHVDLDKTAPFSSYIQVAAFFTPPAVSDADGMGVVRAYHAYLKNAVEATPNAVMIEDAAGLKEAEKSGKRGFLPAVEDLRILAGNPERLMELRRLGVRIATPLWRGHSVIGGAWNTDEGLTDFGRETVEQLLSLGVIPDVSHASTVAFNEIAARCRAAGKPFMATHSCAFSLCSHRRNLTDEQLRVLSDCGGIVGVNLYPVFLTDSDHADLEDVSRHILHLQDCVGTNAVAIGSDFDGVDCLPRGLDSVHDLPRLCDHLSALGCTDDTLENLFFMNGYRFLLENL